MPLTDTLWPWAVGAVCLLLVLRCAARQRHPVLAVLAGAVCGLGVLAVMALLEPVSGIALPLNRYTAFVSAVLGVPGFGDATADILRWLRFMNAKKPHERLNYKHGYHD